MTVMVIARVMEMMEIEMMEMMALKVKATVRWIVIWNANDGMTITMTCCRYHYHYHHHYRIHLIIALHTQSRVQDPLASSINDMPGEYVQCTPLHAKS